MRVRKKLWKLHMYEEGDERGFVRLTNQVYSQDRKHSIEFWLWKYKKNPFGFVEALAKCQGKIVGHMGLVPVDIKIGNRIVRGAQAVDLVVHPNSRRQGIFLALGKTLMKEASEEGIPVAYGIPNEPAFSGHLKYGWFYVCRIPVLFNFLSMRTFLRFLLVKLYYFFRKQQIKFRHVQPLFFLKSVLSWIGSLPYMLAKSKDRKALTIKNFQVQQILSFDNRINDLWEDVSKNLSIALVRKKEYLNWRYFEKPCSDYKVFVAEKNSTIEGYIILSIETPRDWGSLSPKKRGYVVDFLARSKSAFQCLIQTAIQYFKHEKVDSIVCWATRKHFAYECLVRNGFKYDVFLPKIRLISRINTHARTRTLRRTLEDPCNWFFTMGDSDHI